MDEITKEEKVYDTFQTIYKDYDRLNDIISFNRHKKWKSDTIRRLGIEPGSKVLDLCCGTGDFSFMLFDKYADKIIIKGMDFSENMLNVAKMRAADRKNENIHFIKGNAANIPFEESYFTHVVIGFGLRNTSNYEEVLREIKRVLKPGGKIACLDTSYPTAPLFKSVYRIYFKYIMPRIGGFFSKHKREYSWLNRSTEKFLSKKELKNLFEEVGFEKVCVKSYAGGAAAVHMGLKPESKK